MTSMTAVDPAANHSPAVPGVDVPGIDTHKHTHHVAIVDHLGRSVADREFATTAHGYRQIIEFLRVHGQVMRVGVEGTGSYGAGVARELTMAGFTVIEVIRPNRQARRLRGKSDPIDAHQAALAVLAGADTVPKTADGHVESLRILISERRAAAKAKSQTMNQIHALLITAPDPVRTAYRALSGANLVSTLARTRPVSGPESGPELVSRQTLKRLAIRYRALQNEIEAIETDLAPLVRAVNPALLSLSGVGPVVAATLLVAAGDNPERLTTRAAFAALAGVAPMPASSGQRTRHQEPRTKAYFDRRRAEGLTDRDITRCLKRHIANEIYAALLNAGTENPTGKALRAERRRIGIPITVLAATLGVPYQRLRRLEIGTRADPELEQRAILALTHISPQRAA